MIKRAEDAEAECMEQARLLGISGSKELALIAEVERLATQNADMFGKWEAECELTNQLRAEVERLKAQEPVAYRLTVNLGSGNTEYRFLESMKGAYLDNCLEYVPLYLASGAAQKENT